MADIIDLVLIYAFLFGILLTPFIELFIILWLWFAIVTVPFIWYPLFSVLLGPPIIYAKPRSTWNQMWTGKGPVKIRAQTYNPFTGRYEKKKYIKIVF